MLVISVNDKFVTCTNVIRISLTSTSTSTSLYDRSSIQSNQPLYQITQLVSNFNSYYVHPFHLIKNAKVHYPALYLILLPPPTSTSNPMMRQQCNSALQLFDIYLPIRVPPTRWSTWIKRNGKDHQNIPPPPTRIRQSPYLYKHLIRMGVLRDPYHKL